MNNENYDMDHSDNPYADPTDDQTPEPRSVLLARLRIKREQEKQQTAVIKWENQAKTRAQKYELSKAKDEAKAKQKLANIEIADKRKHALADIREESHKRQFEQVKFHLISKKRNPDWLLSRVAYVNKNEWLVKRQGVTKLVDEWNAATDGQIRTLIVHAGYDDKVQNPDEEIFAKVWRTDKILVHCQSVGNQTEADAVMEFLRNNRHPAEQWRAAHWPEGFFVFDNRLILNTATYKVMPGEGKTLPQAWKLFLESMFPKGLEYVLTLWKLHRAACKTQYSPDKFSQQHAALVLMGNTSVGKNFLASMIAKSLGEVKAMPLDNWLKGDYIGCSEYLEHPVVLLSDTDLESTMYKTARASLKKLVAEPYQNIRRMYRSGIPIPVRPFIVFNCNTDSSEREIFESMPDSVREKFVILKVGPGLQALKNSVTPYELECSLPEFLGWLDESYAPPPEIVDTRFMVKSYFDSELREELTTAGDLSQLFDDIQIIVGDEEKGTGEILDALKLNYAGRYDNYNAKTFSQDLERLRQKVVGKLIKKQIKNGGNRVTTRWSIGG